MDDAGLTVVVSEERGPPMSIGYASASARPSAKWPIVIATLAVVVRIAFYLVRGHSPLAAAQLGDQAEYSQIADSLLHHQGLSRPDPDLGVEYAFRMPGYPLFIAACGGLWTAALAAQALLDASSAVAVFLIARRVGSEKLGLIAAGLVIFNPYLIYFSSLLLSETLFTAVLVWGIYLCLDPARMRWVMGVGLLLLSVYVRPSALGLGVLFAGVLGAGCGRRVERWPAARAAALGGLALVLVLLPWALRNKAVTGSYVWTTTNSGYSLYDAFNESADGSSNQADFRYSAPLDALPLIDNSYDDDVLYDVAWRKLGEVGRSSLLSRLAIDYARQHPGRVVELAGAKLMRFWSPVPLSAEFGGRWIYFVAGGLYGVPLFILAAVGLWRGDLPRRTKLILLLPAIYFSLVHSVFVGSLRYRVPCDVPIAVLAAAGAMSFVRRKAIDSPTVSA